MTKCIMLTTLALGLLTTIHCGATILATGDATSPYSFSVAVNAKTYDFATGTLYLGLTANPTTAANIISKVSRPFGDEAPAFTAIGTNVSSANAITHLALATYTGNRTPLVVYTQDALPQVSAITNDGTKQGSTSELLDAADTPQQVTGNIVALAANRSFAFAAVPPANGTFGENNGGIAVICVKEATSNIVLTQVEQTLPDDTHPAVRAKRVDPTIPQVQITQPTPLNAPTIQNFATLHWSEYLQRLYIGLSIFVENPNGGGKAVIVGNIDNNSLLDLENIAPDSAIGPSNNIIAVNNPPATVTIAIPFIRTMLCSTGPSYLIVSGGDLTNTNGLTRVSALPIVDTPDNTAQHGTLADVTQNPLVNYRFTIPATVPGQMPQFDESAVMVGAGPLPIAADSLTVSDMMVIGDTVYVSITGIQDTTHDNGVLYSQALFGPDGKIVRWTNWTKRAFPYRGFCDNTSCVNPDCTISTGCNTGCQPDCNSLPICDIGCQNQGVFLFAVDAVNGKVWAVDGTTKRIVRLTYWDRGGCISQLPCKVSEALCDGCYSVLDLDQATRGFSEGYVKDGDGYTRNTTEYRYALFGGCNKVVFSIVSEAMPVADQITMQSAQTVITDFSGTANSCSPCTTNKENFLLTTVANAGCINQLEYSRKLQSDGAQNYFFAGTNGLYIFADQNGSGFTTSALTAFTQPPFSTGLWHAAPVPFNVPIVAIKTTGNFLYIITRTIKNSSLQCNLYRVTFAETIADMFASTTLLAQTSDTNFPDVIDFSAIQPVTNNDGTGEQLFLTTNKGLFLLNSVNPIGTWQRVPANVTTMFAGMAGVDTPWPATVWPFSVEDPCGFKVFNNSSIFQISGPTATPATLTFVPVPFNAKSYNSAFTSLYPITAFWTDGARRFFVINQPCELLERNRLMVFPYDVTLWNVTEPAQQIIRYDSFVNGAKRFFWVKQIGITGILMAGMDRGVVALE